MREKIDVLNARNTLWFSSSVSGRANSTVTHLHDDDRALSARSKAGNGPILPLSIAVTSMKTLSPILMASQGDSGA